MIVHPNIDFPKIPPDLGFLICVLEMSFCRIIHYFEKVSQMNYLEEVLDDYLSFLGGFLSFSQWNKKYPVYIICEIVISVCLFGCSVITQEPVNWLPNNFDLGSRENRGNVLSLVLRFYVECVDFYREK